MAWHAVSGCLTSACWTASHFAAVCIAQGTRPQWRARPPSTGTAGLRSIGLVLEMDGKAGMGGRPSVMASRAGQTSFAVVRRRHADTTSSERFLRATTQAATPRTASQRGGSDWRMARRDCKLVRNRARWPAILVRRQYRPSTCPSSRCGKGHARYLGCAACRWLRGVSAVFKKSGAEAFGRVPESAEHFSQLLRGVRPQSLSRPGQTRKSLFCSRPLCARCCR
jgi:hypothetical protein